jgi:hypothetical protein
MPLTEDQGRRADEKVDLVREPFRPARRLTDSALARRGWHFRP